MNHNEVRSCRGPDGKELTMAELPPPSIKRWVMRRKATVVAAVDGGLLTRDEACSRYGISDEEYASWEMLYQTHGKQGLRATRAKDYRLSA